MWGTCVLALNQGASFIENALEKAKTRHNPSTRRVPKYRNPRGRCEDEANILEPAGYPRIAAQHASVHHHGSGGNALTIGAWWRRLELLAVLRTVGLGLQLLAVGSRCGQDAFLPHAAATQQQRHELQYSQLGQLGLKLG